MHSTQSVVSIHSTWALQPAATVCVCGPKPIRPYRKSTTREGALMTRTYAAASSPSRVIISVPNPIVNLGNLIKNSIINLILYMNNFNNNEALFAVTVD